MGLLPLLIILITCYLSDEPLPMKYVSSVRAIVFRNLSVLVIKEPDGRMNIVPGGQVEKGETMAETLQRELLEKTGWSLSRSRPFAIYALTSFGAEARKLQIPIFRFHMARILL